MQSSTTSLRYRINISRGMAGKTSWEATVETEGAELEEALRRSDELTAELNSRYPAEIPTPKGKEEKV